MYGLAKIGGNSKIQSEILVDKNLKKILEKVKLENFFMESENFSEIGEGKSETGGKCIIDSWGWTPPVN